MKSELKQKVKQLAKELDDLTPYNVWFDGVIGKAAEAVDKLTYELALNFAIGRLSESQKDEVEGYIDAILTKDASIISDHLIDKVVALIKSPLGDAKETIIIGGLVDIAFQLVKQNDYLAPASFSVGGGGNGGEPDGSPK